MSDCQDLSDGYDDILGAGRALREAPLRGNQGLGRLPGDIIIQRENFSFYFPVTTAIIVSLLLSVVLWFFNR